jgi:hypothetical protein
VIPKRLSVGGSNQVLAGSNQSRFYSRTGVIAFNRFLMQLNGIEPGFLHDGQNSVDLLDVVEPILLENERMGAQATVGHHQSPY